MKRLWNNFLAWRARRLDHLQLWERKRVKGIARFVIGSALGWSGPTIVGFAVADYYFDGTVNTLKFLIEAIYFLIVGLIVGYVAWWIHEGRYQDRIEARINSNAKE